MCSTAVSALGKRTTTAVGRRKVTFAEIFTACYSSMFASAAIIDSMRKDEQRRELDRQLDDARKELADLKEQGKSLRSSPSSNTDGLSAKQMDILWKAMKQVYNERPYRKNIRFPATVSSSSVIESLRQDYYDCPSDGILRKGRQIDYVALEQAILDESASQVSPGARTETQLRHETTRFLSLINELLAEAGRMDRSRKPSPSFFEARNLLKSNHTGYTFRSTNPEAAKERTNTLNESLRQVLESRLPPKEKIGRLCYNMMVSPHVPDIHTYNTLIAGFDKCGYFDLSEAVIYSFFYGRYIRPTQSTFVAILNHNKLMNRPGQFLLNVARITGLDDKVGAKIRRRHQDSLQRTFEQRWATKNRGSTTHSGEYIMEHMPLNRALVEEMMRGLLRFKLFEQAAVLFAGCLKSGVILGSKVVRQLLDECISALDWSAGMQLVRGMSKFGQQWRQVIVDGGDDSLYLINRVQVLLDLCGVSTRGQGVSAAVVRLQVSEEQLSSFLEGLDGMSMLLEPSEMAHGHEPHKSRMLQLESIWKEYVKVRKTTASIESKLLNADHDQEFRESCALHIGKSALEQSERLTEEFTQLMHTSNQPKQVEEKKTKPVEIIERPLVPDGPRIAVAQVERLERGLTMHWSRQMASRPQLMGQSLGFSSL